jgi:hypothetical protein
MAKGSKKQVRKGAINGKHVLELKAQMSKAAPTW